MTTKQQIIKYMNEARSTPRMTNMVKFINEKSTATAKVNTKSHFHVGHTHSSGVRIGSGHSTIHHVVTVTDSNGMVMIDEEITPILNCLALISPNTVKLPVIFALPLN